MLVAGYVVIEGIAALSLLRHNLPLSVSLALACTHVLLLSRVASIRRRRPLSSRLAGLEKLRAERPEVLEQCQAAAGLSLGEYTALVFAGAMSVEDALALVKIRAEAMQQASDASTVRD